MAQKKEPAMESDTKVNSPPAAPDNMRIWNELGKTDPSQTKPFKRQGGFSGTATKPIWIEQRMTEYFGPCGIGWGTNEPQFTVEHAADESFVFCTVGLWYIDPATSQRSGTVYGVGGDRFVTKGSNGTRTSDEAFKMSHTDAIGNAMKHIGVCADIHMGMFEDSKYVDELRREFAEEDAPKTAAAPSRQGPSPSPVTLVEVDASTVIRLTQAFEGAKTLELLGEIFERSKPELLSLKSLLPDGFKQVMGAVEKRKQHFSTATTEKAA